MQAIDSAYDHCRSLIHKMTPPMVISPEERSCGSAAHALQEPEAAEPVEVSRKGWRKISAAARARCVQAALLAVAVAGIWLVLMSVTNHEQQFRYDITPSTKAMAKWLPVPTSWARIRLTTNGIWHQYGNKMSKRLRSLWWAQESSCLGSVLFARFNRFNSYQNYSTLIMHFNPLSCPTWN